MTSNTKWPDFRLASTLWSLVGSQPSNALQEKERPAAAHEPENSSTAITSNVGRATTDTDAPPRVQDESSKASYTMTDATGRPIDGLGGFDGFEEDAQIDNVDDEVPEEDFGAIEMFDSNASQPPFASSQVNAAAFEQNSKAPEAVMFEEPPTSQSRKSKRDKKPRKKKGSSSPQPQIEEDFSRKPKKSRRRSGLAEVTDGDVLEAQDQEQPLASAPEETVIPSTQGKRKRKSSDTGEAKQRKKRKSRDRVYEVESQDVVEETQDSASQEAASGAVNADSQDSPSAARARRRSHSYDARSREYSVPLVSQGDEMDVDNSIPSGQGNLEYLGSQELGSATYGQHQADGGETADADPDVETLAREAWNEHVNGQAQLEANGLNEPANESALLEPEEQAGNDTVYDVPKSPQHDANPPSANSKRTRSVRAKKAKPTYFEKSPSPEKQGNAANELPSPSAMTPAPRKRAKKATRAKKTKAKAEPLSQPDNDAAEGDDEGADNSRRRNRMTGFTQGRFSQDELNRIAKAVEGFRSESGLTQHQVNDMIHAPGGTTAGDEHAALWIRIFSLCPDRHRQKIINITRKKFHNFVARGTWTIEQDTELRDLIEVHGTKWSEIAAIVNRHPEDLRDRYRNYIVCGDAQRKDSWDESEEQNLAQYIMEAMTAIDELRSLQPSRELLKKTYEELIDWQNISERMERTRSRLQCITKWKAMNIKTHGKDKLASTEPNAQISFRLEKARRQIDAMPEEERYRLLLAIQGSAAAVESKIPWPKLVDKKFRNSWHRSTQMLLWRRLKHAVPGWEKLTVRDCAQYLMDQYSQTGELPEIKDEDHNDSQEMDFIQSLPAPGPIAQASTQNGHMSAEFVTESDNEGDQEMKEDDAAPAANDSSAIPDEHIQPDLPIEHVDPDLLPPIDDDEMLIDPGEPVEPELPAEPELPVELPVEAELPEPTPPKATRSAKRTYGKKKTSRTTTPARKRAAAAKKTPAPSQDPIEEVAEFLTQPEATQKDNSDIDEEQYRKKKTPSKFRATPNTQATPHSDASDSVMDDMEDLPARITA